MPFPELLFALPLVALLAWLSAVGGIGGGALLLLLLTWMFGLQTAIPAFALTQLAGNGGRTWFNRNHIHPRLVAWYALGAI
ncbi:sulfite exporter TauE/SafE family protein, partial [Streptomyces roseolus]